MRVVYQWPAFRLVWDGKVARTEYPDGGYSACPITEGDHHHAKILGITPARHRLLHELGHHLIGVHVLGEPGGSPVVNRDAHGVPQPDEDPHHEEWMVTALTYLAEGHEDASQGAIMDIGEKIDPYWLAARLHGLVEGYWLAAEDAPAGGTVRMEGP